MVTPVRMPTRSSKEGIEHARTSAKSVGGRLFSGQGQLG